MRRPAYLMLVEKSRATCIAAVETYNRALTAYREENFAILMINAWELLLKARIIKENDGKLSSVYVRERIMLKNGEYGKRKRIKLTRYGSPYTISITTAMDVVLGFRKDNIDAVAAANIAALLGVRDHSIHFAASDIGIRKKLVELSLATVRNYIIASQRWFKVTFADLNLAVIPISFSLDQTHSEAVAKAAPPDVARFLAHLKSEENTFSRTNSEYSFGITVDFHILKRAGDNAVPIRLAALGETAELTISIDHDGLPPGMNWSYKQLTDACKHRYSDFVQNNVFHKIRRRLESNKQLCHERFLVPGKKTGSKVNFYNPNIMREFDKHYSVKSSNNHIPSPGEKLIVDQSAEAATS